MLGTDESTVTSFKADLTSFMNCVFKCMNSDSTTAIAILYEKFIKKQLERNSMLQQVVKLLLAIFEGQDCTDALPAFVQLLGLTMKQDVNEQLEKLSQMMAKWFSCI